MIRGSTTAIFWALDNGLDYVGLSFVRSVEDIRLLKSMIGANGTMQDADPSATHRVLKETTAAQMVSMMKDVVCQGTGQGAQLPGISVAGKTGTAYKVQKGKGYGSAGNRQYRASFVGFFPADAPRVTIIAAVRKNRYASTDTCKVMIVRAEDGVIVHANPQAIAMFGRAYDDFVGTHVTAIEATAGDSGDKAKVREANKGRTAMYTPEEILKEHPLPAGK